MTTLDDVSSDPVRRVRQDVAAVVLITLGVVALLVCAWQVDPWLLGVVVATGITGVGVYLGFER